MNQVLIGEISAEDSSPSRESSDDPLGRFLKIEDVIRSVGISKPQIYRLMKCEENPFPMPVKIGAASVWVERELIGWKRQCLLMNRL